MIGRKSTRRRSICFDCCWTLSVRTTASVAPDQESMIAHCVDDPDAPAQRSASIDFWCRWFHCCCCIVAQHCQCENYNQGKYECLLWMISRHEKKVYSIAQNAKSMPEGPSYSKVLTGIYWNCSLQNYHCLGDYNLKCWSFRKAKNITFACNRVFFL